jgi:hypothetical protein
VRVNRTLACSLGLLVADPADRVAALMRKPTLNLAEARALLDVL